ncbi:MAG: hypothetical protein ACOCSL_02440 [Thermoplasmatota archaeon]
MKRRVDDDHKGIIGMPLKLIIIVIVAVIAISIMFRWIPQSNGERLDKIVMKKELNGDEGISEINTSYDDNLTVSVFDSNDDPMKDIKVTVKGCGLEDDFTPIMTDSEGKVIYDLSSVELESGSITFEAENPRSNNKISRSLVIISE